YVFDEFTLREQAARARDAFRACWPTTHVLYATKAYFSPFIARLYRALDLGLDVTSEAEVEIARRADFPPDKIYLHGNGKTEAEIRASLTLGIDHLVVDNLDEIPLMAALAEQLSRRPQLLIRLSPDIDPHTHRYLTTGVADSKFGLPSTDATRALEAISHYSRLKLIGLHVHIGSQIFEPESILRALDRALDLAAEWKARFNF